MIKKFKRGTKEFPKSWEIYYMHPYEYDCPCGCSPTPIDKGLVQKDDVMRDSAGHPLIITSGHRCKKHNSTIKGAASNSQHIYGKASDKKIPGITIGQLHNLTERLGYNGIGYYTNRIHGDVRSKKAKWNLPLRKTTNKPITIKDDQMYKKKFEFMDKEYKRLEKTYFKRQAQLEKKTIEVLELKEEITDQQIEITDLNIEVDKCRAFVDDQAKEITRLRGLEEEREEEEKEKEEEEEEKNNNDTKRVSLIEFITNLFKKNDKD